MVRIPVYSYDKCKGDIRYIIQLYDYSEIESNVEVYYTVCCMIGQGSELYEEPFIVRLLTDIIKTAPIAGSLYSTSVSKLIRNSYRFDNKWQREASNRISDIVVCFENM